MVAASPEGPRPQIEATAWNLLLEAAAGEAIEAFRAAGHRSLLIKGVTIARWLYNDEPRAYSDVDILVDPARFHDCESALVGLGFRRSPIERAFAAGRPRHASTWTRGSVTLDLHRMIVGVRLPPSEAWRVLSGNIETWTIGSREVDVLNVAGRTLLLALHLSQHGPEFGRTREDLERALARVPTSDWVDAAELARTLHAETAMVAGLSAIRGGGDLCRTLGLRLEGTIVVEGSPAFHLAQGLLWLMQTKGVRAKARYLGHKLFPPRAVMHGRVAWSRAGLPALTLAYCLRLAEIAVHVPRATWALARVRSIATSERVARTGTEDGGQTFLGPEVHDLPQEHDSPP